MIRLVLSTCIVLISCVVHAQEFPGDPGGGSSGPSGLSLGVKYTSGAISIDPTSIVITSSSSGSVQIATDGTLSFAVGESFSFAGLSVNGMAVEVSVFPDGQGGSSVTYAGAAFDTNAAYSEIYGSIEGLQGNTIGVSEGASVRFSSTNSRSLHVYDDLPDFQAAQDLLNVTYYDHQVAGVHWVAASARMSWDWGEFWAGCAGGAVAGGAGAAVTGGGIIVGVVVGCVVGGTVAVLTDPDPEEPNTLRSVLVGAAVGGPAGTIGGGLFPPLPPPPPPAGGPGFSYWVSQVGAKLGWFD